MWLFGFHIGISRRARCVEHAKPFVWVLYFCSILLTFDSKFGFFLFCPLPESLICPPPLPLPDFYIRFLKQPVIFTEIFFLKCICGHKRCAKLRVNRREIERDKDKMNKRKCDKEIEKRWKISRCKVTLINPLRTTLFLVPQGPGGWGGLDSTPLRFS